MANKATEVQNLIGPTYFIDLWLQLDQSFFKLREPVQDQIWVRVIGRINSGFQDPEYLAKFANELINQIEVIR